MAKSKKAVVVNGAATQLTALALQIRDEHTAAVAAVRMAVRHALAAGQLLIEAKKLTRHGEWLPWLDKNCGVSERTSQFYMWLCRHRDDIDRLISGGEVDVTLRNVRSLLGHAGQLAGQQAGEQAGAVKTAAKTAALPRQSRPSPVERDESTIHTTSCDAAAASERAATVVEFMPSGRLDGTMPSRARMQDAYSLGALPVAEEARIARGQEILHARSMMTAGRSPASETAEPSSDDEFEVLDEDEAYEYAVRMFIDKARDAGDSAEEIRTFCHDAARCRRMFSKPDRWLEMLSAIADEVIAEIEADEQS